jgi:transposase
MIEEEPKPVPSKGWAALAPKRRIGLRSAEMIRKVYEVDPLVCPKCGGRMKIVAFLTEYAVVDRIIRHLELTFVAEKPPPAYVFEQVALMADASQYSWRRTIGSMSAAEESGDYE